MQPRRPGLFLAKCRVCVLTSKACHRGCRYTHTLICLLQLPQTSLAWQSRGCFRPLHILKECGLCGDHGQEMTLRKVAWCHSLNVLLSAPKTVRNEVVSPSAVQTGTTKGFQERKKLVVMVIYIWTKYGSTSRRLLGIVIRTNSSLNRTAVIFQGRTLNSIL